jgi:hypothetical protein
MLELEPIHAPERAAARPFAVASTVLLTGLLPRPTSYRRIMEISR